MSVSSLDAKVDLTVVILTFNEELHIARAISSVLPIAKSIVIVDSGSTDRTIEIAQSAGATVLKNKFVNYALQFQWALDNALIDTEWVMRLDADEVVEADLQQSLRREMPGLGKDVTGINLERKHVFMGRWIRFGGRYPLTLLRIWRAGFGRIENRWMDEHMVLSTGRAVTIRGGFADINLNTLTFFVDKHNKYANREAIDILNQRHLWFQDDRALESSEGNEKASGKRFVKYKVYGRLPFYYSAAIYFMYRYFLQFGFLDGVEGLIYHGLQGWWYRFLVGAKVKEFEFALKQCQTKEEELIVLSKMTNLDFSHSVFST